MPSKNRASFDDDPLTRAMAPPPDETPEERQIRIEVERENKRVSDEIDEEIKRSSKKGPKPVKILLLGESLSRRFTFTMLIENNLAGQSESGRTLHIFKIKYL